MESRKVILHYHLFKNAGTSIDYMLKDSFGEAWKSYDLPSSPNSLITAEEMKELILNEPSIIAWSSHQVVPPLPKIQGVEVYPIVFIRHPIDRARSAYLFEWQKQKDLNKPPVGTFAEYIAHKFKAPRRNAIENFQTLRLSHPFSKRLREYGEGTDQEYIEGAKKFLSSLPFFGIVERYDQSIKKLNNWLSPHFPELKANVYQKNVLQDKTLPLKQRISAIKEELGVEAFRELRERNSLDLELYSFSAKHI